jgi:RNA polymerase-binding transcription factor DksA
MERDHAAKLLEERRHDLERVLATAREQAGPAPGEDELSSYDQHPADQATETVEREQFFSIIETTEASLRDVDAAVRRLDEGKYGICEVCGEPVPDERLEALPETPFHVEHAPQTS